MRSMISAVFLVFCAALTSPAHASSDWGCQPKMKVFHPSFVACNAMGFLSPGNDTRINLVFLLADLHKQKLFAERRDIVNYRHPTTYSPQDWNTLTAAIKPAEPSPDSSNSLAMAGEGSICVSERLGREAFLAAVAADSSLTEQDKKILKEERNAIKCQPEFKGQAEINSPQLNSPAARAFQEYLVAITHFYTANHFNQSEFTALIASDQPWVKEAATYMQARVLLLKAQASAFSESGDLNLSNADKKAASDAAEALKAYVKDYPSSRYKDSAIGLLRRAYWFAGNEVALNAAYKQVILSHDVNPDTLDVINEFDLHGSINFSDDDSAAALFEAVKMLREMRSKVDEFGKPVGPSTQTTGQLEAQRRLFASQPALFEYLLAARAWFVDGDAETVLSLIRGNKQSADLSYLEFSRQILRAAALDKTQDPSARELYVSLFPYATSAYQRGTLELALAMFDERHKNIGAVFAEGTPIQDPTIRKEVLEYVAGPIILRQQATATSASLNEHDTALFRLLSRDLIHGHFKSFLDDVKLLPSAPEALAAHKASNPPFDPFAALRWDGQTKGFSCPSLQVNVQTLSTDPKDIDARLCLGDFFRKSGISDAKASEREVLGGTGTIFAGEPISRQSIYAETLKSPKASKTQRAYALFRMMHCYEPAHTNDCGGKDVPLATRKAWFDELRNNYSDTIWAKELRYYW